MYFVLVKDFLKEVYFIIQYDKAKPFFDFEVTVGPSVVVIKKIAENSGFGGGFKPVLSRKKRKNVALKEGAGGKRVLTRVSGAHSWGSETGNTTESESIDMEEECLVKETSFDYGQRGVLIDGNHNSMPKGPSIVTTKALGKLLDKIDFSGHNNNDNVLLDTPLELPPSLKNLVPVFVRRFFALDIGLDKVATEKTKVADILVNTNLKKSSGCLDQAVVVKKILVGTLAEAVHTALFEFGSVVLIKMQLVRLWQKAVVEFIQLDQADLVADKWSILIRKNAIRVAKANLDKKLWDTRDWHKALLYTLLMGTNTHDIWDFIGSVGGKTCARYTIVCFDSAASINAVMEITPVLKGTNLWWAHLDSAKCAKYENLGHTSLSCSVGRKTFPGGLAHRILSKDNKSRLASIYARCFAPISRPVSFGGVLWANVVGRSSFPPLPVCNNSASSGSSLKIKPTPLVFVKLNDRFTALECSLASLPSPECQPLVTPLSQNQGADIVMSKGLDVTTGDKATIRAVVFNLLVMFKMEETLNNLLIMVMGLLAKMDNAGLLVWRFAMCNIRGINVSAKQTDIVCWHKESGNALDYEQVEGVHVFSSGLDKRFLGAGVAIIMNSSLARYVFKIEDIPGQVISVWLLFKGKLSVIVLGLYAGAFATDKFGQASVINSFIAKAVNSSTFVVFGGDFNENGSKKSASFKFCLDFGLVNLFTGHPLVNVSIWSNLRSVVKTINFIFVSKSLSSVVASHQIEPASDFFDTNHNAISVLIGLGGLLNTGLNSVHKQANRNRWKFKIKDVGIDKWLHFKKCSLVRFLAKFAEFNSAKVNGNLDAMNKHLSKFFKLELLVAKLVKCLRLPGSPETDRLIQTWFRIDEKETSGLHNMINDSASLDSILCHLSSIKKKYCRFKYIESRIARNIFIRKVIEKCMENFSSNKRQMIKSVLEHPFHKVVLDHLVVDNDLILLPNKYAPLNYVDNNAFCNVMSNISSNEFFRVIKSLPNGKAAGLSGISNELWKHGDELILGGLLDITNACLVFGAVLAQ
ncbi:hypothetical protein G9A89_014459 [Geosiphon pyriformis]|nr:hypothetical protein G9A89_014459 [Geosiphon pyriformis]